MNYYKQIFKRKSFHFFKEREEISDNEINNNGNQRLWFTINGNTISLNPGETIKW